MTAKERIDKFIGILPDLNKVNKEPQYEYSKDQYINTAYWHGYRHAKEELRDKLYKKENIVVTVPEKNPLDDWTPEFNMTLFGNTPYER